jgi:hypothetical protein
MGEKLVAKVKIPLHDCLLAISAAKYLANEQ